MMLGRLLCWVGRHKRRVVKWKERGMVRRGSGQPESHEYTISGYRCVRCEPVEDVTNDLIVLPGPQPSARVH
jgi:hypothetical protein